LDLLGERAGVVAELQAPVADEHRVEAPTDAVLEIDQYLRDLAGVQAVRAEGSLVVGVDLPSDALTDHADEPGGFVESDDLLQRAGQLTQQRAEEPVAIQRDVRARDRRAGCGAVAGRGRAVVLL